MRRLVAAGVGLVATLGTIGVAAPAQAATTAAKPFELTYGASYYTGTVTFSNRTVTATGTLHSVAGSGCRWVSLTPYAGTTRGTEVILGEGRCNGQSGPETVHATMDVPGGPTKVVVGLYTSVSDTPPLTLVRTTSPIAR
jgi:hypothetical protein